MPHLLLHTLCHPSHPLPPPPAAARRSPCVWRSRYTPPLLWFFFFFFTLHLQPCTLPILLHHSHHSPSLLSFALLVFKAHTLLPGPGCAEWTQRAEQWPPLSLATQRGGAQFFLFDFFYPVNSKRQTQLACYWRTTAATQVRAK